MEILQYWKIIRRRLWIILLLCAVGMSSALWYTSVQPPACSATAVLINPGVPSPLIPFLMPAEADASAGSLAATAIRYLRTRPYTAQNQAQVEQLEDRLAQTQDIVVKILSTLSSSGGVQSRDTAVIVDGAPLPVRAAYANRSRNLLFALVSSLALGVGLLSLLMASQLSVGEVLVETEVGGLKVLFSGPLPPRPQSP